MHRSVFMKSTTTTTTLVFISLLLAAAASIATCRDLYHGAGFTIPGFGGGYGYGVGYGGPNGGYGRNGVVPTSVVCSERGPCYKKKVTCPAKCFTSYSRSGRNYGGGGGGGGCSIDCNKHCVGYC